MTNPRAKRGVEPARTSSWERWPIDAVLSEHAEDLAAELADRARALALRHSRGDLAALERAVAALEDSEIEVEERRCDPVWRAAEILFDAADRLRDCDDDELRLEVAACTVRALAGVAPTFAKLDARSVLAVLKRRRPRSAHDKRLLTPAGMLARLACQVGALGIRAVPRAEHPRIRAEAARRAADRFRKRLMRTSGRGVNSAECRRPRSI